MTSDAPLQKADFGAIYDQPDPRAYFTTLEPFDYAIPGHGADIVRRLLKNRARQGTDRSRVLDVCCSYGVVATLLKTDLALADVYAYYRDAADRALTSAYLVDVDRRLLHEHHRPDSAPDTVWVATFCLRTYDYGPIARTLHQHGLQTECLPRTFRQRRFTGPEEREWALEQLRERGIDPTGRETDGFYHAELYLSRPAVEVVRRPLERLLPGHGAAPH